MSMNAIPAGFSSWKVNKKRPSPDVIEISDQGGFVLIAQVFGAKREERAALIASAPEMANMLLSMYLHVSHGGPTRADVEALLKKAGVITEIPSTEGGAMSIARSTLSPAALVYKWNQRFPIGTRVRYWTGVREGSGRLSCTQSEAEVLGGHTAVVWVDGEPGCISLSHIEPLPEGGAA